MHLLKFVSISDCLTLNTFDVFGFVGFVFAGSFSHFVVMIAFIAVESGLFSE